MILFRLALRSHRTGLIATAAMGAVAGLLNSLGYLQVAGTTHAERVAFAAQMSVLGQQLSYLLPRPVQLDTVAGYLTWRDLSSVGLIYAIWAMLAATGAGRGDEERGLVEQWLSTGVSRVRWLLTRCTGFAVAATLSLTVTLALTAVGAALAQEPLPFGPLVLEAVALLALTLTGFGLGIAIAQLAITRRAASITAGMLLVATFVVNSADRSGIDVGWFKNFSPFYAFERSAPLLEGRGLDLPATAALFLTTLLLMVFAAIAFGRRDLGGPLIRVRAGRGRPTACPSSDPFLRLPVLAAVDQQRFWIAGWAMGLAVLGYFLTSIARTLVDSLRDVPGMRAYFEQNNIAAYSDVVGVVWFGTALLLLSVFVVAQVNAWASEDADGRLETALAATASRSRIVLERIAALLVAIAILGALSTLAVYGAARIYDITVPFGRMLLATALTLPVAFALGAVGHALVGWRPRVAVALLGAVSAVSYFDLEFASIFNWPDWVRKTSIYTLYGMPLSKDDPGGIAILVAIGLVGTAVALVVMRRRDVGV